MPSILSKYTVPGLEIRQENIGTKNDPLLGKKFEQFFSFWILFEFLN